MNVRFIDDIHLISAEAWHTLVGTDYPFLRHEFLAALEASQSVGCLLYTSPSPRDGLLSRMPSSA